MATMKNDEGYDEGNDVYKIAPQGKETSIRKNGSHERRMVGHIWTQQIKTSINLRGAFSSTQRTSS